LRLEEMRTMKMKRFIFEEAQAGPDSDRIMKQNTARCQVVVAGGEKGRRSIFIIKKSQF
jgi:hypothetical protein